MDNKLVKSYKKFRVMIVDDVEGICNLLKEVLLPICGNVETFTASSKAITAIENNYYDIIITDLKMPYISGLDILKAAKEKDEYTEVIIVTGHASMDSASEAINLGVTSYLTKPIDINEFMAQFERAAANRVFHLNSVSLMRGDSNDIAPEVQKHIHDLTALYYFSRKLVLALEVQEVMRIVLEEANERMGTIFCIIGINFLETEEIYAMPKVGKITNDYIKSVVKNRLRDIDDVVSIDTISDNDSYIKIFTGRHSPNSIDDYAVKSHTTLRMNVLGKSIGFISVFFDTDSKLDSEKFRFFHVFTSMISPVIEQVYVDARIRLQAKTDGLTGIANHRMFHELLEREISRSNRVKSSFCIALIDIDDFKKVNDTYGHLVGDAVLVDLARRVEAQNRSSDVVARYGGEEFIVILPDTDLEGGGILAERIRESIAGKPYSYSQKDIFYSVSIGVACYDGNTPREKDWLISSADKALYSSKENGKNKVTLG